MGGKYKNHLMPRDIRFQGFCVFGIHIDIPADILLKAEVQQVNTFCKNIVGNSITLNKVICEISVSHGYEHKDDSLLRCSVV